MNDTSLSVHSDPSIPVISLSKNVLRNPNSLSLSLSSFATTMKPLNFTYETYFCVIYCDRSQFTTGGEEAARTGPDRQINRPPAIKLKSLQSEGSGSWRLLSKGTCRREQITPRPQLYPACPEAAAVYYGRQMSQFNLKLRRIWPRLDVIHDAPGDYRDLASKGLRHTTHTLVAFNN